MLAFTVLCPVPDRPPIRLPRAGRRTDPRIPPPGLRNCAGILGSLASLAPEEDGGPTPRSPRSVPPDVRPHSSSAGGPKDRPAEAGLRFSGSQSRCAARVRRSRTAVASGPPCGSGSTAESGTATESGSADGKVSLTFETWLPTQDQWTDLVAAFEKENPNITIDFQRDEDY